MSDMGLKLDSKFSKNPLPKQPEAMSYSEKTSKVESAAADLREQGHKKLADKMEYNNVIFATVSNFGKVVNTET